MPGRKPKKQPMLNEPEQSQQVETMIQPASMVDKKSNEYYEHHTPNPDHLLELWSISGTTFKSLLESLKAILNEANLVFTEKGLKLATVDTKQVALVHLFMDADAFEYYRCTEKLVCGVDVDLLYKTIKSNTTSDLMSMVIHKDERDILQITFENKQKGEKTTDKINLMSLPEYRIEDFIEYDNASLMCSHRFQKICRDMWTSATTLMEIEIVGDKIIFQSLDGITKRKVEIEKRLEDNTVANANTVAKYASSKGTFFLWYLKSFAKASNLSTTLILYLNTNSPLVLEFSIPSFGTLKFALASVSPEETEKVTARRSRGA